MQDIRRRPPHRQILDCFNAVISPDPRPQSFAAASMELWFAEMQAEIAHAGAACHGRIDGEVNERTPKYPLDLANQIKVLAEDS